MQNLISNYSLVGFSGSRAPSMSAVSAFRSVVPLVQGSVAVGCASGIDALTRSAFPSALVFSVAGRQKWHFAKRSIAFVQHLQANGGLLVSFPSSPCPSGLLPSRSASRCFAGYGSGSWATLAFAVGIGVPCLVYCPSGPKGWSFRALGGGWFYHTGSVQQNLF